MEKQRTKLKQVLTQKYTENFMKSVCLLQTTFKKILKPNQSGPFQKSSNYEGYLMSQLEAEEVNEMIDILDQWGNSFVPKVLAQFLDTFGEFIDSLELDDFRNLLSVYEQSKSNSATNDKQQESESLLDNEFFENQKQINQLVQEVAQLEFQVLQKASGDELKNKFNQYLIKKEGFSDIQKINSKIDQSFKENCQTNNFQDHPKNNKLVIKSEVNDCSDGKMKSMRNFDFNQF